MLAHDLAADFIQLSRGNSGSNRLFHGVEHAAHNLAGRAHAGQFFGRIDGHVASG
jgi:hypothetical protein